jgi:hypothetical protein
MACAGSLWLWVLVVLLQFDGVPLRTFLATVFFIVFFAVSLAYYARTAIFVDARGVTYRGVVKTLRIGFEDIRKLDVLPGLVTVYSIRGKGPGMHFTSFFAQHRRLMELVVSRAGLAPSAA